MEGISWYRLRKLIERNSYPWRTYRYYRSRNGFKDTISIADFSKPKRTGVVHTGYSESDWYRDSYVCNAGYFAGTVPIHDKPALWDPEKAKWDVYPVRGARSVLKILRNARCVRPTPEVEEFIRTGYWHP